MAESTAHSSSSAAAAPAPPGTSLTTSGPTPALGVRQKGRIAILYICNTTQGKATVNWKRLQTKTRVMTALAPTRPEIPAGQVRKAKIAYSALFFFMLLAWSAILIGKIFKYVLWLIILFSSGSVFTLRENYYDCEACSRPGLCRYRVGVTLLS